MSPITQVSDLGTMETLMQLLAERSVEQLLEEVQQIKQFVLLYPPQGEKGPPRTAYVLSQQTLAQQALVKTLGLAAMASWYPAWVRQRNAPNPLTNIRLPSRLLDSQ